MPVPKLRIENLSKTKVVREGKKRRKISVLRDISLEIRSGEFIIILGPSGAGKSTLLRLINRLEEPSSGSIYLDGTNISELRTDRVRQRIGLVFQVPVILTGSVREELSLPLELHDIKVESDNHPEELLRMVSLDTGLADRDPTQFSLGQKQRLALARSLALKPEVLLLDEPTSALDPASSLAIENLILKLNRKMGLTILFVTHNVEQAKRLGKDCAIIIDGGIIETGKPEEIFERTTNRAILNYLGRS